MRTRNALGLAAVSLVLGIGIGAAGSSTPKGTPGPSAAAAATQSPAASPTATPQPSPTPESTAAPTAAPTATPITITGQSTMKSAPFALAGNYTVNWTASTTDSCLLGVFLERADGTNAGTDLLVNQIVQGAAAGTTNLYNLPATSYYLDANSECTWSFTFTPA